MRAAATLMSRWVVVCLFTVVLHAAAALPERFDHWLKEEVPYLITNEERKTFLDLPDDASREKFIEGFWEARNPARGSGRNPYREEIQRRLAYVAANFGRESGTPGWRTDMGRTWILFGKPDSRVPLKGYSQLYPLELWMYSNNTGSRALPGFYYVMFFMPEDIGEYRYYKPFIDGPLKLVRGTQFRNNRDVYRMLQQIRGDVAHAAFSLIPSEPLDTDEFRPSMTGDALVARIQDWANSPDQVARVREGRALTANVKSLLTLPADQPLSAEVLPLTGFDGSWWVDYAVLVAKPEYGERDGDRLRVSAGFRLMSINGDLIVDDNEQRSFPAFDGNGAFLPFLLSNRIPVVPGSYRLEITLTNRTAGRMYKVERQVAVSEAKALTISAPILAVGATRAEEEGLDAPFRFAGIQFVPIVDTRFQNGQPLRTLIEVRSPAGAPQDVALEYVVAHLLDREQRIIMTDRISATEFRNGLLLKSRTLALGKLTQGNYRVIVTAREPVSGQVLASTSAPLQIDDTAPQRPLFMLSNLRGAALNGVAAYIRGLAAMSLNDRASAAKYLQEALRRNPANTSARAALASLK
jgi:GWxTD domain-containing protein